MYTDRRVKARSCFNIVNYNLEKRGKKPVKSYTTVYNRSRPKDTRSIQAKKHKGKGLFCFRKPPKAGDKNNGNTKYQRGQVKKMKYAFFEKNHSTEVGADPGDKGAPIQYSTNKNQQYAADDLSILYSADDKNYLRPGTSEDTQ